MGHYMSGHALLHYLSKSKAIVVYDKANPGGIFLPPPQPVYIECDAGEVYVLEFGNERITHRLRICTSDGSYPAVVINDRAHIGGISIEFLQTKPIN